MPAEDEIVPDYSGFQVLVLQAQGLFLYIKLVVENTVALPEV